jgi:hypothetical protein
MNIAFEVGFELTREDFEEIVRHAIYRRPARRVLQILRVILAAVVGVCALLTGLAGDMGWAIFFGVACLVVVGETILGPKLAVRSLQKTPFYQGKIRVLVDDSGTRFVYRTGDSNTQWSGYVRYQETKHLFLLFVSKAMFRPIPKRALSAEQISQLREMLQQRISSAA